MAPFLGTLNNRCRIFDNYPHVKMSRTRSKLFGAMTFGCAESAVLEDLVRVMQSAKRIARGFGKTTFKEDEGVGMVWGLVTLSLYYCMVFKGQHLL